MINSRKQMIFEKWMENNHLYHINYWENNYSEFMDLDEYIKEEHYSIWKEWIDYEEENSE
jgi:hypothetical protein